MTTLSQGSTADVPVGSGDFITLNNASRSRASIEVASKIINAYHAGSASYGPFPVGTVRIAAISGSLEYSVISAGGNAAVQSGPALSGGYSSDRPYIQLPGGSQLFVPSADTVASRRPRVIASAASYSDWSTLAGQSNCTFSKVANARGTKPAIRCDFTAATNPVALFRRNLGRDIAPNGKLGFWLYLPPENFAGAGYTGAGIGPLKVRISPDDVTSASTNRRVFTIPTTTLAPGWTRYTIDLRSSPNSNQYTDGTGAFYTDAGTMTADLPIRYVEVEVSCPSTVTGARYCMLESIDIGEMEKPSITLCFDGLYFVTGQSASTRAIQDALADAGIHAALCIRTGNSSGVDQLTSQVITDASRFYNAGWDIVQMTAKDINYSSGSNYTQFQDQFEAGRARIKALGWTRAADSCFAYPNNAPISDGNSYMVSRGVQWIRGHQKITQKQGIYGWDGPYAGNLTSAQLSYSAAATSSSFQRYLRHAVDHGENACIFCHELVSATADTSLKTIAAQYQIMLDEAIQMRDAGLLDIFSPTEFLAAMTQRQRV